MVNFLKGVIKLSQEQYEELIKNKTITVNNTKYDYDENIIYIVEKVNVTIDTKQTISGDKDFTGKLTLNSDDVAIKKEVVTLVDSQEVQGEKNFVETLHYKGKEVAIKEEIPIVSDSLDAQYKNNALAVSQGIALKNEITKLIENVNGRVRSFSVENLEELGNLFGLSISEIKDSYEVETKKIKYNDIDYTLITGDTFYVVSMEVPDYWFSADKMKLYKMETTKVDLSIFYTKDETDGKYISTIDSENNSSSDTNDTNYDEKVYTFKDGKNNEKEKIAVRTYKEASKTQKGLMSAEDKNKLDEIEEKAQVNVQSDWKATSGDAFIKNKPTKVSEFENDSKFATEEYVEKNGGKIDIIKLNGVVQEINEEDKSVSLEVEIPKIPTDYYKIGDKLTGIDLNVIIVPGNYGVANDCTNIPIKENGTLFVGNYDKNTYVQQMFISSTNKVYTRTSTSVDNSTWTEWISFARTNDIVDYSTYDLVIKTQEEFEEWYTALDEGTSTSTSILLVGDGIPLYGENSFVRADGKGIKLDTNKSGIMIHGINFATIVIENFIATSDAPAAICGSKDSGIIELGIGSNISGITLAVMSEENSTGIAYLNNISDCMVYCMSNGGANYGLAYCSNISNSIVIAEAPTGSESLACFGLCTNISNCTCITSQKEVSGTSGGFCCTFDICKNISNCVEKNGVEDFIVYSLCEGVEAKLEDIPDVSNFITREVDNLINYTKNSDLTTFLEKKQDKITTSNKLSSDLISGLGPLSTTDLTNDGKIPNDLIPASAITNTFTAENQTEMLMLDAEIGDICVRIDLNETFILKENAPNELASWQKLLTPTDAVQSVNGKIGIVELTKKDVGLSNVDNTSDIDKPISKATQDALDLKVNTMDLADVAKTGSYKDLIETPNIPSIEGLATEEQVETKQDKLSDNQMLAVNSGVTKEKIENLEKNKIDKDVNNLTNYTLSTGVGSKLELSMDEKDYILTVKLKNSEGTELDIQTLNLPLETMVVNASYDNSTKEITLTLQNGSTTSFSVADLVSGLATQSALNTTNANVDNLTTRVGDVETNINNLEKDKADASDLSNYVLTTRKINNKALSTDITLNASDVGALPSTTTYVSSVNGKSGEITGMLTNQDKPNINGNNNYTSSNSFYAPIVKGNYGQVLMSNGSGAPSWTNMPDIQGSVTLKGLLPAEYQEVEYLECDGNQYIDTGFAPSTGVNMKLSSFVETIDDYTPLIGTFDTKFGVGYLNETRVGTWYWTGSYINGNYLDSPESLYNKTIDWEIQTGTNSFYKIKVESQTIIKEYTNTLNYEYGKNLYLFYDGMYYFKGRVGRVKIVQEGEIVRDLVPCYRKEDNIGGMYDLTNGEFHENLGSSPFVFGTIVEDATVKQYQFMAQNIYQGTKLLDDTYVSLSRQVNGHALNKDIEINLKDLPNYEWSNDNLSIFLKNESYKSSNLINLEGKEETLTERGVTITRRTDGTFLFNGTVTSSSSFLYIQLLPTLKVVPRINTSYINTSSFFDIDETTNYYISSNILSGSVNYDGIGQTWKVHTNGQAISNVTTFPGGWSSSYNKGDYINSITIMLDVGSSFDNAIIGIKVEKGSSNTGYIDWSGKIIREKELNELKSQIPSIPDVSNFITKDVNNLTNYTLSTEVGTAIELSYNKENHKITAILKNSNGTTLHTSSEVDLPLESVVVDGSYDSNNKKVILTLQNGNTIDFSVADLVSGLATTTQLSNYLSLDGGTIKEGKTITLGGTSNSTGANLKWNTVNSNSPYIGYASDQSDGTFLLGSLTGTTYKTGLAIGGGSGNLLWKGTKVATTSDIPTVSNGTLTLKKNGTSIQTFTANQSTNVEANFTFGAAADKDVTTSITGSSNLPTDAAVKTFVENKKYLTSISNSNLPTRLQESSTSGVASADNATTQGWHYITTGDEKRPPFKQVDGQTGYDYRVMTTAYSSTWYQQIATDFRSNDVFIRRMQNGTLQPWTALVKMPQGASSSEVVGTDNALVRWDATRNATVQNSNAILDDTGNLSVAGAISESGTKLENKYATKSEGVYYVEGLTTTTAGIWEGTNSRITSYYDGLTINFKVGVAGGDSTNGTTLNINGLGAKPCYLRGTTKITTHYAVGTMVILSYNATTGAFYSGDYDANSNVKQSPKTTNGNFPILLRGTSAGTSETTTSTSFSTKVLVNPSTGNLTATTFTENGTTLANKYLGKTAKASDSSKLNGKEASYYVNTDDTTYKFAQEEYNKSLNLLNENRYLSQHCTYANGKWTTSTSIIGYNHSIFTNEAGWEGNRTVSKLPYLEKGTYSIIIYDVVNNGTDEDMTIANNNANGEHISILASATTNNLINGSILVNFNLDVSSYVDIRLEGNSGTISFSGIMICKGTLTNVIPRQSYQGGRIAHIGDLGETVWEGSLLNGGSMSIDLSQYEYIECYDIGGRCAKRRLFKYSINWFSINYTNVADRVDYRDVVVVKYDDNAKTLNVWGYEGQTEVPSFGISMIRGYKL